MTMLLDLLATHWLALVLLAVGGVCGLLAAVRRRHVPALVTVALGCGAFAVGSMALGVLQPGALNEAVNTRTSLAEFPGRPSTISLSTRFGLATPPSANAALESAVTEKTHEIKVMRRIWNTPFYKIAIGNP